MKGTIAAADLFCGGICYFIRQLLERRLEPLNGWGL